jgi:hypothetical protein
MSVEPGDLIGIQSTNSSDNLGTASPPGATYAVWVPGLPDGGSRAPNSTMQPSELGYNADVQLVSNEITLGALKKNKSNGTAKLTVTVPNAGALTLFGKGLKRFTTTATAAGDVVLPLKPKGKTKRKLNQDGKAKVTAHVQFAPTGISPLTTPRTLTLRKKP